jgi:hypothetical protein
MDADEARSRIEGFTQKGSELRAADIQEQKKIAVDNLKPSIEATLAASGFETDDAIKLIDEQTKAMEETGVLTDVEASEARRSLTNWATDTANERKSKIKKAEKETTTQLYTDYTDQLIDGTIKADEVMASFTKESDKNFMRGILDGSYQPPPEKTDWDGYKNAVGVVMRAASHRISTEDGLKSLMSSRYTDETTDTGKGRRITDSAFQAASNRVIDPYPQDVAKDLSGTMKEVEEQILAPFWGREQGKQERIIEVNTNLMSWVDRFHKNNDKYPTGKEINSKAAEFNMKTLKTLPDEGSVFYNIGDTIPKGGYTYEITGFRNDGMPIVNETPLELR